MNAHAIMERSSKVAENNWKEAPNYSFIRADVKTKRNSEPTRKSYEVLMIDGSPYSKVIAEDGTPLTGARLAEEERKLQLEMTRRSRESSSERQRRISKYVADRNRDHALLSELADAFDYTIVSEETIDGHNVWVLEGTPKPGYVPRNAETKVLANMNVKFWIDKPTYQWLRVEAQVMKTVSLYGALAKVGPGTQFMLEQQPISPKIWLPKHFNVTVKAAALGFINENSSSDETYRNYRPMGPVIVELQRRLDDSGQ
jgi:hypothetical protein